MRIEKLFIDDFRCLSHCEMELAPGINCIAGDNASGKTSLLEAIYILGRGNSFRQPYLTRTIRAGAESSTLRSALYGPDNQLCRLAVQINRHHTRFKLNGRENVGRYDLISALPLQFIDPNVHRLLEQGPRFRRRYLDWGVFHVEHAFFPAWRRYRRALKQRNRALRTHRPKHQIVAWDTELVQQGEVVDACRRRFLALIQKALPQVVRQLMGDERLEFEYQPGWRGSQGFGIALAQGLEKDIQAGFTQQGPHRADMRLSVSSRSVQDWISRGQQKLLSAALLLTQAQILKDKKGVCPVLLFDDMTAELGHSFQTALVVELRKLDAQCLLTFLGRDLVPGALKDGPLFHVEQGRVTTEPSR